MAFAIGLIISIERGWQGRVAAEGERAPWTTQLQMLATAAILLALLVNTATKVALAWTTGGPAMVRLVSLGSTAAVGLAGIGLPLSFSLIGRLGNS